MIDRFSILKHQNLPISKIGEFRLTLQPDNGIFKGRIEFPDSLTDIFHTKCLIGEVAIRKTRAVLQCVRIVAIGLIRKSHFSRSSRISLRFIELAF